MISLLPEWRLFPFVSADVSPRLRNEYLKIGIGFYYTLSSHGILKDTMLWPDPTYPDALFVYSIIFCLFN